MGSCVVAVTRNGLGDFYLFSSFSEADEHPIIQYGDVICLGPEHIRKQYTLLEIPDLLRRLGDEGFRTEVLMKMRDPAGPEEMLSRYLPRVWSMMCDSARQPPEDPGEIVSVIRRDRKLSIKEGRAMSKEEAKTAEKTEAAAKEPKAPAAKTYSGYPEMATITLLADKDGKVYGPDHNPKRPGSATHGRFALYKNGMTIKDAIAAGVQAGDLPHDIAHSFITVNLPKE